MHQFHISNSFADFRRVVRIHTLCPGQTNELLQGVERIVRGLGSARKAINPLGCTIEDNNSSGLALTSRGETIEDHVVNS